MRDRRTVDTRRPVGMHPRRNQSQPRALLLAVGLFVVMLLVVAALLMSGNDDPANNDEAAILAANSATSTPVFFRETPAVIAPTTPADTQLAAAPTPSPTLTIVSADATATPEPVVSEEPTEPEATEEIEAPVEEPTPTEEPAEELPPTEEPIIGEFGELPPPQLVSGGLARPLTLQYQLDVSLATAPTTAPVYLLLWPAWSADGVASVAGAIGLTGDVVDQGGGSFQVSGENGDLFVSSGVVQYVNGAAAFEGVLEDDGVVIATARQWLLDTGLIGANIGEGTIVGRDDTSQRAVVAFKPVEPAPLLAFVPSATVTIGPGGDVREANVRWPDSYAVSEYGLRSIDELWNEVLAGEGAYESDLTQVPGSGPLTGTLTVTSISVAYSYAGNAAGDEFLVPLLVFSGDVRLGEYDMTVPLSIYVSAVYGQAAPRG